MMSCLNELNKRSADIQYFATKPTVCGLKFTNINNFWCIFKVVSFFFFFFFSYLGVGERYRVKYSLLHVQ